jgi:hypothetical protein
MPHQSLVVPSTAFRRYDNLYKKKWSRHSAKDKTYGCALCSMDFAVVFHPSQPGGRIQADKFVSPGKDPPIEVRAYASLHRKVCARVPDHPPGAAYYAQTAGGSVGAPGGTVHFRELLPIFFCREGRHHHAEAGPAQLRHMPADGRRPW